MWRTIHGTIHNKHPELDPAETMPDRVPEGLEDQSQKRWNGLGRLGRAASGQRFEIFQCFSGYYSECSAKGLRSLEDWYE